ncbi:MAG: hypothetical protein Q9169_000920 [Polycauliona sp. 2 TL-2023]
MEVKEVTDGGRDDNKLSEAIQDLSINNFPSKTQTAKGKKRKNHRGGKKKSKKQGQENRNFIGDNLVRLYEVRATASKGLGVFATRDITRGTRIMSERPLLRCSRKPPFILIAFCQIPVDDQKQFLSLSTHFTKDNIAQLEDQLRSFQDNFLGVGDPNPVTLTIEQQANIVDIFATNCFGTHDLQAGDEYSAVFADACRINHSCLPNVRHGWNDILGHETVHAVQDIKAGEEIVTTYIGVPRDRAGRQSDLSPWGFQCDCRACDISTEFGQASDGRRKRMMELDHIFKLQYRYIWNDYLQFLAECMDLHRSEGIQTMEMVRNYLDAANVNEKLGNLTAACEWQELALELIATCAGSDSEVYHDAQEVLQNLRRQQKAKLRK